MARFLVVLGLLILPLLQAAGAQTAVPPAAPASAQAGSDAETPSTYDRIWERLTRLYEDRENPVVQRVLFTGRFHQDFATIDADQGSHDEWNVRRLRLGPRVTLFRTFTFHGEVELDPQERDPAYVRLTDMYVQWSRDRRLAVTVGKQGMPYTMDGATSSRELIAVDRGNLTNNIWFPQEYLPGVSVSGTTAPWVYRAGAYSAGRANREFGEFSGAIAVLGTLGYDLAGPLGVKEALLAAHYVHQDPDPDNTFTRRLEDIVSITFKLEDGRLGLRTDVSAAGGYLGQSDLWGVMAMPYLSVTARLQLVGRYTLLHSEDVNGVQLAAYETRVVAGRGDRFEETYLGANYFFYGHRLKLQSGVQFGEMRDRADDGGAYSGVSWTTGLRVGW